VPEVDWDACFTSVEAQAEFRKKYTEALRQTPDEANERRLMDPEQFEEEERKRNVAYDPVQRWLHIQQTITWAEANMSPEQRRNRPRPSPGLESGFYERERKR